MSVKVSVCVCRYICRYVYICVCICVCVFVCLPVCLSVCLHTSLCMVFVEDVMWGEGVLFTSFSDLIQMHVGGSEVVASSFFTTPLLPYFQNII